MLNTVSVAWRVRTSSELSEGDDVYDIAWRHLRKWVVWRLAQKGKRSNLKSLPRSRSPPFAVIVRGPGHESKLLCRTRDKVLLGIVSASSLFQFLSLNGLDGSVTGRV